MSYGVLSLDGGGVRGIMETVVLDRLDDLTSRPLVDIFQLQIASSTGGLIQGAVNCPLKKYSFKEITELYKSKADEIFHKTTLDKITNPEGIFKAEYSDRGLNKILKQNFKKCTLGEVSSGKIYFTAFDLNNRNTVTFNSTDNPELTFRETIRRCSAAPTYFTPRKGYVDGGVGANNPAALGYAYAIKDSAPPLDTIVVSVGTGKIIGALDIDDGGILDIGTQFPRLFLDGHMSATDLQMRTILKHNYVRIQFDIKEEQAVMDNADPENLDCLEKIAEAYIDDNLCELKQLARRLDNITPRKSGRE